MRVDVSNVGEDVIIILLKRWSFDTNTGTSKIDSEVSSIKASTVH